MTSHNEDPIIGRTSRRDFLKYAGAAGVAVGAGVGLSGAAAACGGDKDKGGGGTPTGDAAAAATSTGAAVSNQPIGAYKPAKIGSDQMRISFLGTSFLPRIAQQCNSVFVEVGNGDTFVFDYGSGVSSKYTACGITPRHQDKVFITHLHGDHTSDLITLYCFGPSQDRKTPLYLFGPSGPSEDEGMHTWGKTLKKLMKWHEEAFSFLPTGLKNGQDGYEIITKELPYMETGTAYEENGVKITHFPAIHDRDGSISYKLEWNGLSMIFTGDTRPNDYVLDHGKGVDVLIHEMVVPPDVWAAKNMGLQPGDPNWDAALQTAEAVQESSHTPELALGYILSQTLPRLGIATHFQVNDDTIDQAWQNVQTYYRGPFAIATDLLVCTVTKDEITLGQATVDDYAWYPPPDAYPADELAPPKYPSPTAQLNKTLLSHEIPEEKYTPASASPSASPSA